MAQQPKGSPKENAIRGIIVMVAKVANSEISDESLEEIEGLALPALMAILAPERSAISGIIEMVARVANPFFEDNISAADLDELAVPALMAILAQEERREGPGATDGEEMGGRAAEEGASPPPSGSKGDLDR